jgi:hypothetical protein
MDCVRDGGPFEQLRTALGRRGMEQAAHSLPVPEPPAGPPLEVYLLTGRRFWYQTAFCLWTLSRHANRSVSPIVFDDGSLKTKDCEALRRLFPSASIVSCDETLANLDHHLPVARFPVLRERWQHYPNIRKLIDVHAGSTGWKLVLDSDLLFFRRPTFLIDWLDRPRQPLHAVDCETSYGYSMDLLAGLAGSTPTERLNVGLCGLQSEKIDWDRLESWCRTLIDRAGTHYYLEQALVALLLAGKDCAIAPAADYVTLPRPPEAQACGAVMHHYVAGSKKWYFRNNWRRAMASQTTPPSPP